MEQRIDLLEEQLAKWATDSTHSELEALAIKDTIIQLQARIVEMKDATITGLRRYQSLRGDNRKTLGIIAFCLLLLTLFAFSFVLLFSNRLKLQGGTGVMGMLAGDLRNRVSAEKPAGPDRTKVHFLVWISVIIMFFSLVMYLFEVL